MELMTLKPSLASKLNVSGFSPMHLALQNNHTRMVRGFVALDSSLVRIKGRGRVTPLHHVARIGNAELLSEFLFACPSSIEDLTIKCETAVHVAVKNHQLMAFKVLMGWLKRVNKEEILDWKDEDGNTVFHIAASINHTEVIKSLRKTVKLKAKNLDTSKRNDAILVVAVLIVTATYQVGLSPPGGVWQENSSNPTAHSVHHAGQMTMSFNRALFFLAFNGFAFLSSLYVLSVAMLASYATIFPTRDGQLEVISATIFILAFRLMIATMLCATFGAFTIDKCRRDRVDFPASCFCS
ncbi:hypothetical protein Bca101_025177 [Brassica carinata]